MSSRDSEKGALFRFFRGLVAPTPLAGVATLVATVLGFGALLGMITPARMATDFHTYFQNYDRDFDVGVTSDLLRLRQAPADARGLLVSGTSVTGCSIDPDQLASDLGEVGLPFDDVYDLRMAHFRAPHLLVVSDQIPKRMDGLYVIGINLAKLHSAGPYTLKRAWRLGVRSPSWDKLSRKRGFETPLRTGIFLWDNRRFYGRRLVKAAHRWWDEKEWIHVDPMNVRTIGRPIKRREFVIEGRALRNLQKLSKRKRNQRIKANLAIVRKTVLRARRAGLDVVFYIPTVHPDFARRYKFEDATKPARTMLVRLADKLDVPIVRAPDLDKRMFRDPYHLRKKEAIDKVTLDIAEQIGDALVEHS